GQVAPQCRNTGRPAMRTLLFLLAIFAVTAGIGTPAQAQNYPWCAQYSGLGGTNCGFTTFQQCMATLAGMGGFCNVNTQYVPPGGQPAPRARRQGGSSADDLYKRVWGRPRRPHAILV